MFTNLPIIVKFTDFYPSSFKLKRGILLLLTKCVSQLENYLSYQAKIFLVNLTPKELIPCKISHICRCAFKNAGFKIEIKTNLHIVDFLNVTFNLLNGTYKPYKKPNDQLLYANTSSNHPPQIIKQLPTSISNRLSNNSSNKQVFDMSKDEYEKALRENGYKNVGLIYTSKKDIKQKRIRSRNIIWFNSPFNKNVYTNVAKRFLNLIDQHFPKSNKLHAIFNRNTVNVSYSCTQNMSNMIKSYNKNVINKDVKELKSRNCGVKSKCPLNGRCQVTNIIYKCIILSPDKPNKVYLETAEGDLKK